jgi:ABC-type glycerol-3-phosphate transport system substrate-binding protein
MRNSRGSRVAASLALAMLVATGGLAGCGGAGSGDRAAVVTKADAVDVTYYYLPG